LNGEGKVGLKYDLATRTLKNTGTADITLTELIEKATTLAPGEEKTLDAGTRLFEVQS